MTAPLIGLSPWILPLIAIAAKRKEAALAADRARLLPAWLRRKAAFGRDAPPLAMDARSDDEPEATIPFE